MHESEPAWQQHTVVPSDCQTMPVLDAGIPGQWNFDSEGLSEIGQSWLWDSGSLLTNTNQGPSGSYIGHENFPWFYG